MVKFINNIATDSDRAVYAEDHSDITFDDNSTVTFTNNKVTFGASVYSYDNSKIIVKGNSTVIFNDLLSKWCANTCVPYTGQNDVVTIDITGTVWCSDQKAFMCLSEKCHCNKLEDILANYHTFDNIRDSKVTLSSVYRVPCSSRISIIGHNNLTVNCANKSGLIMPSDCKNVMIKDITWIGCGAKSPDSVSVIKVYSHKTIIQNCIFQHSLDSSVTSATIYVFPHLNHKLFVNNCKFVNNNHHKDHGVAIHVRHLALSVTINNCNFSHNGPAKSLVYSEYDDFKLWLSNTSFHDNQAVSIYVPGHGDIHINGQVIFENNIAENGAALYISDNSTVKFIKNSNVKFINNSVHNNGAVIFLNDQSSLVFDQNSTVTFNSNKASQSGGTIHLNNNCKITFKDNSSSNFVNNIARDNGGVIFCDKNSDITFKGNSTVGFVHNIADNGGVFYCVKSTIIFKESSMVSFNNNKARGNGGVGYFVNSKVTFEGNVTVKFDNNMADAGMLFFEKSYILFKGSSNISLTNNKAILNGGALYFEYN